MTVIKWKAITDFPMYSVNNIGQVWSRYSNKILKPWITKTNYLMVGLWRDKKRHHCSVHRLVLISFKGSCPKGKECNHIDGDKSNNNINNLEWITSSENNKHAFITGLNRAEGENNNYSKLTNKDVYFIRALYATNNFTQKMISKMVGVGRSHVCAIINRRNWKHI